MNNMNIALIEKSMQKISTWSGGTTREIYLYPEDGSYKDRNFKFRVSSATVDLETSDFTKLEGVHRLITTLDKPIKLTHDGEKYIDLKPYDIYEFDGANTTKSVGKATDFNLMCKGSMGNVSVIELKSNDRIEEKIQGNLEGHVRYLYYIHKGSLNVTYNLGSCSLNGNQALLVENNNSTNENVVFENFNEDEVYLIKTIMNI